LKPELRILSKDPRAGHGWKRSQGGVWMDLSLPAKTPLPNFLQHPSIDVKAFADIAVLQQAIILVI